MKADILVLGAFGCGAFRNNPEVVAKAYKAAMEVFPSDLIRQELFVHANFEQTACRLHDLWYHIYR